MKYVKMMFSSIKRKDGKVSAIGSLIFSLVIKPANIKTERPMAERIDILKSL